MTLLGYQFPDLAHVEYDSNWLIVKIEVSQEGYYFEFRKDRRWYFAGIVSH